MSEFWNGLLTHQMTMRTSSLGIGIDSSWHAVTEKVLKLSLVENRDGILGEGDALACTVSLAYEKCEGNNSKDCGIEWPT